MEHRGEGTERGGPRDPGRREAAPGARGIPLVLLAAAALAFLLPFGTVSCGEPVSFTGLELATADVEAPPGGDDELAADIEESGTALALVALLAIVLALVLVAAGLRGWGVPVHVALAALLLLPWVAAGSLADFVVRDGYVVSLAALTGVAALRRASALTRRRAAGRRRWPAVLAGLVLSIPVVGTAVLCAWSASVSGLGTYGGFVA